MGVDVDHYSVLGLPSGEEGAKLSEKEISKAYKAKLLVVHPDKRLKDPDAHDNFLRLTSSYEVLKDEKKRKLCDDHLRVKLKKELRHSKQDSKRRKMVSDLEERERAAFAPDPTARARDEDEVYKRKLREDIARMNATSKQETTNGTKGGSRLDKEKILKVSWEKVGDDYTAERLRELFSKFGDVEDVVINSSKKRGSALVVMTTKEAVVSATGTVSGDLSNPLLVLPLQPAEFPHAQRPAEPDWNLVGAGYQAFEDEVLEKARKVAARHSQVSKGASQTSTSFKGSGSQNAEKIVFHS